MSKALTFPSEVPALVRVAAVALTSESERNEFYDRWRHLRQCLLNESALNIAASDLVAFFYEGETYVGLMVLGNPYSISETPLFDLTLAHEEPAQMVSCSSLEAAWQQLGQRSELFIARTSDPFLGPWSFSYWPSARLALVNS